MVDRVERLDQWGRLDESLLDRVDAHMRGADLLCEHTGDRRPADGRKPGDDDQSHGPVAGQVAHVASLPHRYARQQPRRSSPLRALARGRTAGCPGGAAGRACAVDFAPSSVWVPAGRQDAGMRRPSVSDALDRGTRAWWRLVGRPVDLEAAHRWLSAPISGPGPIGSAWLAAEADRIGGWLDHGVPEAGLLPSTSVLDGATFRAADLDPVVRDFYERTASWRMEVWTQWSALFQPAGELISRLFGRRVQQLALPTRALDVAHGIDSQVVRLLDADGRQVAAGWLRTLAATGEFVYSGCYSVRRLPGSDQPSVHVSFPLESGNVQVFLRPSVERDGSLILSSPAGPFGSDGAYVVVRAHGGRFYAARIPLHERFHVYRDRRGVLRTDHELRLYRARVLHLHYRLDPAPVGP